MINFYDRTSNEQDLIRKAYEFEIDAIEQDNAEPNPYCEAVKALGLWEAINEAVEIKYNH